jgi:autotransporter-associated beta strand protein
LGRNTTVNGDFSILNNNSTNLGASSYTLGTLSIGAHTLSVTAPAGTNTGNITFGATTLTGNAIFDVGSRVENNLILGAVGGSYGLTKNGVGTLRLTEAGTFTGSTLVSAGTLVILNNLALQNSALNTSGVGSIDLTGYTTPTFGGLSSGAGARDLSSLISTGYGSITSLTLNLGAGANESYNGVIGDGAAGMTLTKNGSGTQVLSGSNTYTGATTINAGTLQIGAQHLVVLT